MSSKDEIRESILQLLYEEVEENAEIPTLASSKELVKTLTGELDDISEDDVLYIIEKLDESGTVDFSKHSDGHGSIKIWPQAVDQYQRATESETFRSDGRLKAALSALYQHDRETNGEAMAESELADETNLDEKSLNAVIWYLYNSNFIEAGVDNTGWHSPSISEQGRNYYERKWA